MSPHNSSAPASLSQGVAKALQGLHLEDEAGLLIEEVTFLLYFYSMLLYTSLFDVLFGTLVKDFFLLPQYLFLIESFSRLRGQEVLEAQRHLEEKARPPPHHNHHTPSLSPQVLLLYVYNLFGFCRSWRGFCIKI